MTGFHAIKTNLRVYSSVIASLDEDLVNEKIIPSVIKQLNQFKESFSAIDLPPVRIEVITPQDRSEVIKMVDQIADRFYNKIGFSEDIVTLWNISPQMQDILDHLSDANKIGALKSLTSLTINLEACASQASSNISSQVLRYMSGPLTPEAAQETIESISQELTFLKSQLLSTNQELQNLVQITTQWIHQNKSVPQDFLLEIKAPIQSLFHVLGKISASLVHEAENLHPAKSLLYYRSETALEININPSYCLSGRMVLKHFQKLEALLRVVKNHFNEKNPSWAILLYNFYRLAIMIDEADRMVSELPNQVELALQCFKISLSYIKSQAKDATPNKTSSDDFEAQMQQLEFTKDNLDQITNHSAYLEAKEFLSQLRKQPETAFFFEGNPYPSPLSFQSDFWLLQPLQLTSWKDVETLYVSFEKYTQTFFSLLSIFRSRSEHKKRKENLNAWIPLAELDELTLKLETC